MSNAFVQVFYDHDYGTETFVTLHTGEDLKAPYVTAVCRIADTSRYSWREPDATVFRKRVDIVLRGSGLKRDGARWVLRNERGIRAVTGVVWCYNLTSE